MSHAQHITFLFSRMYKLPYFNVCNNFCTKTKIFVHIMFTKITTRLLCWLEIIKSTYLKMCKKCCTGLRGGCMTVARIMKMWYYYYGVDSFYFISLLSTSHNTPISTNKHSTTLCFVQYHTSWLRGLYIKFSSQHYFSSGILYIKYFLRFSKRIKTAPNIIKKFTMDLWRWG